MSWPRLRDFGEQYMIRRVDKRESDWMCTLEDKMAEGHGVLNPVMYMFRLRDRYTTMGHNTALQ